MYGFVLLLHVLAATVWTGGHLVLALSLLPRALRERSTSELLRFESAYERVGIPALLVQVVTGLWLARLVAPDASLWFSFSNPVSVLVGVKLLLLGITLVIAAHARIRVIPKLTADTLGVLAWHIVAVTAISVLFVVIGVSFRTGWFY
jgi:putative copper export protein